jgi:DNA-binding transcriptional MocR family regulator
MKPYWEARLSEFGATVTASEIRELLKVVADPAIISFAGGIPDPRLFPIDEIRGAYGKVFASNSLRLDAFQYSLSEGYPPLRQWISEHLAERGVAAPPESILITNGSQQGLDFVARLLLRRGDAVVVSRPSYLGALQTFAAYGARFLDVPMDDEGMLPGPLEAALGQQPKLLYLVPDFANPSGVTTSAPRRATLVALARRHGVPVIEDSAYERLRYEGELVSPVLALDQRQRDPGASGDNVLFLGTFSKVIAPALRIGWVVAPAPLREKLVLMKQASDLHCSTINQIVLTEVLPEVFQRQVDKIVPVYRQRRDAMLRALAAHFPAGTRWTRPAGGMFVWVDLPPGIDAAALLENALAEIQVAFVPGAPFHTDRTGRNTLRLSFSTSDTVQIETGIERLGRLLHRHVAVGAGIGQETPVPPSPQ